MKNENKLVNALKSFIIVVLISGSVFGVIKYISTPFYMWAAIFFIMIVGIGLTCVVLKEEPLEFFDDFGKWEDAKVSSMLMLMAAISFIATVISLIKK